MTIEARRVHRGVSGALLALALVLLATAQVAQADTIYPDNVITGSHFDTGLSHPGGSGWTEVSNDCTVLAGLLPSENPQVCQTHTSHAAGIGTPPGSLQQSYNGTADGLAPLLFESTAEAESSTFTIAAPINGASGKTTFEFDRRADVASILNLEGQATFRFMLADVTANTEQELWFEELDDSDNTFLGRLNDGATHTGLPGITFGHTYKIKLTTVFNCAILCLGLQETVANFDNLRLRVVDGTPTFGPPTAVTSPPIAGEASATLQSQINPNGRSTTYYYDWGPNSAAPGTFANRIPASGGVAIGSGVSTISPNAQIISGLAANTEYRVRVTATNSVGTAVGATLVFKTIGPGATGPQGPAGTDGTDGTDGTNGTNGNDGAPGAQGPAGPTGAPGPAGAPGARGPAGAQGTSGASLPDADSSSRLAMMRIDATTISVPMRGRNVGRVRVRVFCRQIAVRTCSGNMKVRSLNPILPNSLGLPAKAKRRVTFATDAVQLDVGKVGFAILNFNAQRRSVLRREGRVRSTVIITVIDADNNRQNVRKVVTVVRGSNS